MLHIIWPTIFLHIILLQWTAPRYRVCHMFFRTKKTDVQCGGHFPAVIFFRQKSFFVTRFTLLKSRLSFSSSFTVLEQKLWKYKKRKMKRNKQSDSVPEECNAPPAHERRFSFVKSAFLLATEGSPQMIVAAFAIVVSSKSWERLSRLTK